MNLNQVNYINSSKYLPIELGKNEYFQKICSLIDSLVSENSEYFTYEKKALNAVINKYRDFEQLDQSSIHQVVAEFGFQYIIDIFELPDSQLKDLTAYLALINMLKGSKPGLELVLSLLGMEYKIKEWFEDPATLPEKNTYALELWLYNVGLSSKFYKRFYRFSREYVYPLLAKFLVYIRLDYGKLVTGACTGLHPHFKVEPRWYNWKKLDYGYMYTGACTGIHPKAATSCDTSEHQNYRMVKLYQQGAAAFHTYIKACPNYMNREFVSTLKHTGAACFRPNYHLCPDLKDHQNYRFAKQYFGFGMGLHTKLRLQPDISVNEFYISYKMAAGIAYHPVIKVKPAPHRPSPKYSNYVEFYQQGAVGYHPKVRIELSEDYMKDPEVIFNWEVSTAMATTPHFKISPLPYDPEKSYTTQEDLPVQTTVASHPSYRVYPDPTQGDQL